MIDKEWFVNNSEGYLGDDEQVAILFILREPDSKGEIVQKGNFWFKQVVNGRKEKNRYYKIIGKEACLLLKKTDEVEALKMCAYINLYPHKGEASASGDFRNRLKNFHKGKNCDNRWDIINNLPHGSCIVTTQDIAHAIKACKKRELGNSIQDCSSGFQLANYPNKHFHSFCFRGIHGDIKVYSMYHPKPRRYHFSEDDIQFN